MPLTGRFRRADVADTCQFGLLTSFVCQARLTLLFPAGKRSEGRWGTWASSARSDASNVFPSGILFREAAMLAEDIQ